MPCKGTGWGNIVVSCTWWLNCSLRRVVWVFNGMVPISIDKHASYYKQSGRQIGDHFAYSIV